MSEKIVLNDLKISQVEALAAYLSIEDIALYLGISPASFYNIKNRQPEVLRAYQRGVAKARSLVASKLMGFIEDRENTPIKLTAIMFYLRTQAGWSDKQEMNLTTKDITPKDPPSIINIFTNKRITERQTISDKQSENEE